MSIEKPVTSRHDFLGCPIDSLSFEEVVSEVTARITSGSPTSLIHFLNVAKIVKAQRDDRLREALWEGDFVVADGKPLLCFGRGLKIAIPTRVNGTDLMEKLIEVSDKRGFSIYLFGAEQNVVEKCVEKIKQKYPNIRIAGYRNGYFCDDEINGIICDINESSSDILFIGLPTPKKEFFAYDNRTKLKVPIVQGVGGSFDVLAGSVNRAPKWMQNYGLEWLYRILQEPRRLFWRYLSTNIKFLWIYFKQILFNL
ncbi:MAG: WecB/TagA/CpsF family glycosyltransferase [Deltaproteobacteria bacterium]|nr:WecB/TagA/CpsF family glycosyltransferase [Deltaproteobacteria bacterium]